MTVAGVPFETAVDVGDRRYDVVIAGAGVAGAILAKALAERGRRVLILEAGTGQALSWSGYLKHLDTYRGAAKKGPNAPYPNNPDAPRPDGAAVVSRDPAARGDGYLEQAGPHPLLSDYVRAAGGTTLHWLGSCPRMLPDDFRTRSLFGVGLDWPIGYADLKPYYARAEREIGVSADIEDQRDLAGLLGLGDDWLGPRDAFPMRRIPPSYGDGVIAEGVKGAAITYDGETYPIRVTSTPAARNGAPNPAYPGGYSPVGAVGNPGTGQRCQGNSACVPICPVQAKYSALKSLDAAVATGRVDLVTQAVVHAVRTGPEGRAEALVYKAYGSPGGGHYRTCVARGAIFALAANPVENSKILLNSGLGGPLAGRYLMDHPVMLTWGLADRPLGAFRGPGSTSGIETLRTGAFRRRRAAFRVEIDNWGWNWAAGAPWTTAVELVSSRALFGAELRRALRDHVQRQVRLGWEFEVPPNPANRITLDPKSTDRLGEPRPVVSFDPGDYVGAAMAEAKRTSDLIFAACGITDHTRHDPADPGYMTHAGKGYVYQGAGHFVGGHIMGASEAESVVDRDQRVWGRQNLWLVGCGVMPTEGTSNPTLTMAALTLMAADRIHAALGR